MARPRVFVSSTYYDLKHIRSSLDMFIESLGFDAILSEKGDVAYSPDVPLDESCYREVDTADIFVLLIGGRYGSEASGQKKPTREFFERYESITKKEYERAVNRDIPIYIMVESSVYGEYHTYLQNKALKTISYAHVDSVNVFSMIEAILAKPRNNPTHTFERFADIEQWLREQWAGLFRDILNRRSQQQQLAGLSDQIKKLQGVGDALQTYIEKMLPNIAPGSEELIQSERARLAALERFLDPLKGCRFNMQLIGDAIRENHVKTGATAYPVNGTALTLSIIPSLPTVPACPNGGTYTIEAGTGGAPFNVKCTAVNEQGIAHGVYHYGVDVQ
jgi:hypothetical protein